MLSNPSSTPIAPKGMGPGSVLLLLVLLLGFGAFYWLSHDPNVLDAFSDLKKTLDAPQAAAPAAVPAPAVPGHEVPATPRQREKEQIENEVEAAKARLERTLANAKALQEAESRPTDSARASLVLIGEPECNPSDGEWLVSGEVYNTGGAAGSKTATITLLIDGEPAEEAAVRVGPVLSRESLTYEVHFRPSRDTQDRRVTARAIWKR
ncbi:MAG TPA: hypothetical protein VGS22_18990 [Thermoanaerobaculia bacterium]|jgi:hypothetical protein|nr:hypothetical protein [Thermoanaerobaculia bacterium]